MLEHVNIAVGSIDAAARFFRTAFPHWRVRGEGQSLSSRWLHLGTDDVYVCLNEPLEPDPNRRKGHLGFGFNHIGFVVHDVKGLVGRMREARYRADYSADVNPHRTRAYIFDADGIEYEFVQYHSDDPAERNEYD